MSNATPELEALYRQLALRHPELWGRCPLCHGGSRHTLGHGGVPEKCSYCGGTDTIVPPFAEWLGRLVRAGGCGYMVGLNGVGAGWALSRGEVFEAPTPEEALLRAMLAAEEAHNG